MRLARRRLQRQAQSQYGQGHAVLTTLAPDLLLLFSVSGFVLFFFFDCCFVFVCFFFPPAFYPHFENTSLPLYLSIKTLGAVLSIGPDGIDGIDCLCPTALMKANTEFIRRQAGKPHPGQSRHCN